MPENVGRTVICKCFALSHQTSILFDHLCVWSSLTTRSKHIKRVTKNAIYYDKTQHAHFWGRPLFQATNRKDTTTAEPKAVLANTKFPSLPNIHIHTHTFTHTHTHTLSLSLSHTHTHHMHSLTVLFFRTSQTNNSQYI